MEVEWTAKSVIDKFIHHYIWLGEDEKKDINGTAHSFSFPTGEEKKRFSAALCEMKYGNTLGL